MQRMKKYFTEGLIQFAILLSLIGVRVDVETYLNGYLSPLVETDLGPSSAYIQTPFHNLRDTLDGYSLHPKCPDLDSYFASRRLLDEVRTLGSPRFPTQLSAWLVHLVPATEPDTTGAQTSSNGSGTALSDNVIDSGGDGPLNDVEQDDSCTVYLRSPSAAPENDTRPCPSEASKEDGETMLWRRGQDVPMAMEGGSPTCRDTLLSLDYSHALGTEGFHGNGLCRDMDQRWQDFLSLPGLDDLDLGVDITSAISQDVSLQDAMVTEGGASRAETQRGVGGTGARRLFRMESSDSSHWAGPLDASGPGSSSGFLDEAVFEQINLLGLGLGGVAGLEEAGRDSDSGLSLGSGSRSPSSSEASSSGGRCEGAVGYSSESELSCSAKGRGLAAAAAMATVDTLSPMEWVESVRHDHTYPAPLQNGMGNPIQVKEELLSEEDDDSDEEEEEELSRDERRARALSIPLSVQEIVGMPVEDFLSLLGGQDLTAPQVTLLRDIRRRGKNKLAARNCRRRKLEAIGQLEGEVEWLERRREQLQREQAQGAKAQAGLLQRLQRLSDRILSQLRLCPSRYTLDCTPDGTVSVRSRDPTHRREPRPPPHPRCQKKKDKKH
ncbi:hypothetical protein JZ751_016244 [Albula glossodonta]|uniref:BZIP domain-containing protein n=1 Tax=Albula glossodonta TaxID=121402 RepID=A0A8T2N677_9TELE|nr:hypothetical protein JZ751_016244 [Albula glossodonta]